MMRTLLVAALFLAVPLAAVPTASASEPICTMAGCVDPWNPTFCLHPPAALRPYVCWTELC